VGAFTLTVDGTTHYNDVQRPAKDDPFLSFFGAPEPRAQVDLTAGEPVEVGLTHVVELPEGAGMKVVTFALAHAEPRRDPDEMIAEAVRAARGADTAVVVDTRIGGYPVSLIGIESKPVPRAGFPPTDGPDTYTAGTLFPRSSKKVARAINAASGNRPLVVLANLSGFDGSPESMRNLQLEYGAEIGRAIVNFQGPIVFCVISRYHGGAFVVFSKHLNPSMTVLAIEGSYASVLGGAPAAAVVFAAEVSNRAAADPPVAVLEERHDRAEDGERGALVVELAELRAQLRADKIAEVAAEFDDVHNIHRAVEVGSVDEVIAASDLRPKVIEVIERAWSKE
jgi:acetyl-CoA carboxylase carboxyltransferase component